MSDMIDEFDRAGMGDLSGHQTDRKSPLWP